MKSPVFQESATGRHDQELHYGVQTWWAISQHGEGRIIAAVWMTFCCCDITSVDLDGFGTISWRLWWFATLAVAFLNGSEILGNQCLNWWNCNMRRCERRGECSMKATVCAWNEKIKMSRQPWFCCAFWWVSEPNQREDTQHIQEASETKLNYHTWIYCKWNLLSTAIPQASVVTFYLQKGCHAKATLGQRWVAHL